MKLKKDIFLFSAKDNLISKKKFDIYWDSKKHIAWTDIIKEKSLSKYYISDSYDSFKEKPSKLIDYIYFYVQNLMLSYKWSITKQFILKESNSLDVGSGIGVYAEYCLKKGVKQSVVENNIKALNICNRKGLKAFNSLEAIPSHSKFRIITFWHSLEHIINLNTTLAKTSLLLDKEGYPTFFEIEERKKHHAFLKGSIKRACLISGIEFLKGFYKNEDSLNSENSHDGVHISCGDWAMKNSRQIFLDI